MNLFEYPLGAVLHAEPVERVLAALIRRRSRRCRIGHLDRIGRGWSRWSRGRGRPIVHPARQGFAVLHGNDSRHDDPAGVLRVAAQTPCDAGEDHVAVPVGDHDLVRLVKKLTEHEQARLVGPVQGYLEVGPVLVGGEQRFRATLQERLCEFHRLIVTIRV